MLEAFLLALALCTDTFVASLAYGTNKVTVKTGRILLLNGVCTGILLLALGFGSWLNHYVPEQFTLEVCVVSLVLLGVFKLSDYFIKRYINKHVGVRKHIHFSISSLRFIIQIYGNPMEADKDKSNSLSVRETVYLGLAMSLDSLIAGTLAAFLNISVWEVIPAVFFMGIIVMFGGLHLGKKIAMHCNWDLSWLSAVLFIGLGISKLF